MTNDGPAFVMTNHGDSDDTYMYCITMVVPYTPCYFCKEVPKKLWKCSKCWLDLRFPVRYCCKKCQVLDFPTDASVELTFWVDDLRVFSTAGVASQCSKILKRKTFNKDRSLKRCIGLWCIEDSMVCLTSLVVISCCE